MKKSLNQVLSQQLKLVKPDEETSKKINLISKGFIEQLKTNIKKKKIDAQVFIGGSLAKGTLAKKGVYDVDIFVRFNEKYEETKISRILGKLLGRKAKKVHGSRDYYQVIIEGITMEVIPVLKIKKPDEAKNVMDLSYFHVNYVLGKIKRKKNLAGEIILTKSFCHAQNCYGAESYVRGFSGYALELLICYYGSFEKFLRAIVKDNKEKIVIDDSKFYKKGNVFRELNESKLNSPIILIDPTYKERNALAGLSAETFGKFKNIAKQFLKKPSLDFFVIKNIGEELKKEYGNQLRIIAIKTTKQTGDIAGTKSKKFFEFMEYSLKKDFSINLSEFNYNEKKNIAELYFVLGKKQDELISGPLTKDGKNLKRFKQVHKKMIIKKGIAYARVKHNLSFEDWMKAFIKNKKKIMKQMSIKNMKIIQ